MGLLKCLSPEDISPRVSNARKKGDVLNNLQVYFLNYYSPQVASHISQMTFFILSQNEICVEGKYMWVLIGVKGWLLCSHFTSTLIPLASTESVATAHWKGGQAVNSTCVPGVMSKRIWLNRENGEVINQNREHRKKRYLVRLLSFYIELLQLDFLVFL